ncbi:unnamed protein product, partial [Heterotrigona itama]
KLTALTYRLCKKIFSHRGDTEFTSPTLLLNLSQLFPAACNSLRGEAIFPSFKLQCTKLINIRMIHVKRVDNFLRNKPARVNAKRVTSSKVQNYFAEKEKNSAQLFCTFIAYIALAEYTPRGKPCSEAFVCDAVPRDRTLTLPIFAVEKSLQTNVRNVEEREIQRATAQSPTKPRHTLDNLAFAKKWRTNLFPGMRRENVDTVWRGEDLSLVEEEIQLVDSIGETDPRFGEKRHEIELPSTARLPRSAWTIGDACVYEEPAPHRDTSETLYRKEIFMPGAAARGEKGAACCLLRFGSWTSRRRRIVVSPPPPPLPGIDDRTRRSQMSAGWRQKGRGFFRYEESQHRP